MTPLFVLFVGVFSPVAWEGYPSFCAWQKGGAMTLTTHRQPHDSEALSCARLEQPWRDWAKIARNFACQMDNQWDREDLTQDIIVRLAEVAEEYRQIGEPLTRGGCIR